MANASQYGLHPLGPSGISMDTSKAMAILGFSPSQTFDSTSTDEINKAFMKKLHVFLKPLPKNKNEEKMKKAEDARRQDDSSRGVVILYTVIHGYFEIFETTLSIKIGGRLKTND